MIKLEITAAEAQVILKMNSVREKEIKENISKMKNELVEIAEMNKRIEGLLNTNNTTDATYVNSKVVESINSFHKYPYDPNFTNAQKIEFVLKAAGRAMTSAEIINEISKHQPGWDRMKIISSISAVLSMGTSGARGTKILYTKSQNGKGENVYELKK